MKKLKVYHYFWLVSFLILIIGFVAQNSFDDTFDINIHDTYYVIQHIHFTWLFSISYFLLGVGYWFLKKILRKSLVNYLTLIHCLILFGSFIAYWIMYFYVEFIVKDSYQIFDASQLINQTLLVLFLLIIFVAQPIYFINLLIGIFRKSSATS